MSEQLKTRPEDQPLPTAGGECVQDALIKIIEEILDGLLYLQQIRMMWDAMTRTHAALNVLVASGCEQMEPGSASEYGYNVALDQIRLALHPHAHDGPTDLEQQIRANLHQGMLRSCDPANNVTASTVEEFLYDEVLAPMVKTIETLQDQLRRALQNTTAGSQ